MNRAGAMWLSPRRSFNLLFAVVAMLVLGPPWLVQRDFWDGAIGTYGIVRRDFSGIYEWLVPSNWGLVYLLLRGVEFLVASTGIPPWLWIRLLVCLSVLGIAVEARLLCSGVFKWSERESNFAALVVLSFPCWYVLYGATFIYLVFIWMIFAGHRLLHGINAKAQALGYVLVLLSFQVNSNFVMIFALEGIRLACHRGDRPYAWGRALLVTGSAVMVYLGLRLVWPPAGAYQGYNNLVLPVSREGLLAWLKASAMAVTWLPLLAAPAAAAWWFARRSGAASPGRRLQFQPREALAVALLLAGGLFAYMAVGKGAPLFVIRLPHGWLGTGMHLGQAAPGWFYTTADGWSIRNAFLFSLPAGVCSAFLVRTVLVSRIDPSLRGQALRLALATALTFNAVWLVQGHAAKQLRAAQELSVIRGLKQLPAPAAGLVDLSVQQAVGWTSWSYESNYLMWLAYGRSSWSAALYGTSESGRDAALREREESLQSPLPPATFVMDTKPLNACRTTLEVSFPDTLGPSSMLSDVVGLTPVPAARILVKNRNCPMT